MITLSTYRSINLEEISPLFNNVLKIKGIDHTSSIFLKVSDVIAPFLIMLQNHSSPREMGFEVTGIYLVGSALTNLFAKPNQCRDIDLKILIKKTQETFFDAFTLFNIFENTPFILINGSFKTLHDLTSDKFKPGICKDSYCYKGCKIEGAMQNRPLDILFLSSEDHMFPASVMNIDSLFIPLKFFCFPTVENSAYYPFSAPMIDWMKGMGTKEMGIFHLHSSQGEIESVICDIQEGRLTSHSPQNIKKFGWPRFILALIEGYISLNPDLNQVFQDTDMGEHGSVYNIHQFVIKKHLGNFQIFWFFFTCQAIFHSLNDEYKEKWNQQFLSILNGSKQELPWMPFFKEFIPVSLSKTQIQNILILMLPLFAQSIHKTTHQGKRWLHCDFEHNQKKFYLLIPPISNMHKEELKELLSLLNQKIRVPLTIHPIACDIKIKDSLIPFFCELAQMKHTIAEIVLFGWLSRSPFLFEAMLNHLPPLATLSGEKFQPFKIQALIRQLQNQTLNPKLTLDLLFSLNSSFLSLENKQFIHHSFMTREDLFQSLLDKFPESFSSSYNPFKLVEKLIYLADNKQKSKTACILIRKILQKYQQHLHDLPASAWESFLEIVKNLASNQITNPLGWKKILLGLSSSIFKNIGFEPQNKQSIFLRKLVGELLRISQFSWEMGTWDECFQIFTLIEHGEFEAEKLARHAILKNKLNSKQIDSLKRFFKNFPFILPHFIDDLIEENRGIEALELIEAEEEAFHYLHLLQADPKHVHDYIIERYPNREEQIEAVWNIYSKLYEDEELSRLLEKRYIFQDEYKRYLLQHKASQKSEILNQALLFNLNRKLYNSVDRIDFQKNVIFYSDFIPVDFKRKCAIHFIENFQEMNNDQFGEAAVLFYLPALFEENLFSLAEKSLLENAFEIFSHVFSFCDEKQKLFLILKIILKKSINFNDFPFHIFLAVLERLINQETLITDKFALQRIDDLINAFSIKLYKHANSQEMLMKSFQIIPTSPPQEKVIQDNPILANISEKIITALLHAKIPQSIEIAMTLFYHIHRVRIIKCEVENLLPDVNALLSLMKSASENSSVIHPAFETVMHVLEKIHPHLPPSFHKILNFIFSESNIIARQIELNEPNMQTLARYFINLYKTQQASVKNFNKDGVKEEHVQEAFAALISKISKDKFPILVNQLLKDLSKLNVLDGKFIHWSVEKLVEKYEISFVEAYLEIFMGDYFKEDIPLEILLNMMLINNIGSWNINDQELYLNAFTTILDDQFIRNSNKGFRKELNAKPFLDFYLALLKNSRMMHLAAFLISDFLNFPDSNPSQKQKRHNVGCRQFIIELLELKQTRPYLEQDRKDGKVNFFMNCCEQAIHKLFQGEKKGELLRALTTH